MAYNRGDPIEVAFPADDGLQASWWEATVLEVDSTGHLDIACAHLRARNGEVAPFVEDGVPPKRVRPLPPHDDSIETPLAARSIGDPVDCRADCGWWEGHISVTRDASVVVEFVVQAFDERTLEVPPLHDLLDPLALRIRSRRRWDYRAGAWRSVQSRCRSHYKDERTA